MQPVEQAAQPRFNHSAHQYSPKSNITPCPECGGPKIRKNKRCRACRNKTAHPPERPETFEVDGDLCRWLPLTKGRYAIVLADHYARCMTLLWHVTGNKRSRSEYASTFDANHKPIKLHQFIAGYSPVDHINGDGLDNRPRNLRPCNDHLNVANAQLSRANKPGFKGVRLSKNGKMFTSHIIVHREDIYLGQFVSATDAARAYDIAAAYYFGEYARLNFHQGRGRLLADKAAPVLKRSFLPSNNKSGYLGVSWERPMKQWRATVYDHGKAIVAGYSHDPVEAAQIRDRAAFVLYGARGKYNFRDLIGELSGSQPEPPRTRRKITEDRKDR